MTYKSMQFISTTGAVFCFINNIPLLAHEQLISFKNLIGHNYFATLDVDPHISPVALSVVIAKHVSLAFQMAVCVKTGIFYSKQLPS